MTIDITIAGVPLSVEGKYTKAEPKVGLRESFEINKIVTPFWSVDVSSLIEWAGSQGRHALEGVELECLKQIDDV